MSAYETAVMRGVINQSVSEKEWCTLDTYNPLLADEILTPSDIGGIPKDTKVEDLRGMSISEVLDMMLFPVIYPTFTPPTAKLSYSDAKIVEVGAVAPSEDNFTKEFDRGEILSNGEFQNYRAGEKTSDSLLCNSNMNLPSIVSLGDNKYVYRVNYAEGSQPLDSRGGNYEEPLQAGYVDSEPIVISGTYPWYASTEKAGTLTKQKLIKWSDSLNMNTGSFVLKPQAADAEKEYKQSFLIPRVAQSILTLNPITQQWEDFSSQFSREKYNHSDYGDYYLYYNSSQTSNGEITLKVIF